MDVDQKLEELSILIEEAKAVPLSASCMVNRAAVQKMHNLWIKLQVDEVSAVSWAARTER